MKVALEAPDATETEAGMVTAEIRLFARVTVVSLDAALERLTVQVVDADPARVVVKHCSEVSTAGVISERFAVRLTPFKVALAVAG